MGCIPLDLQTDAANRLYGKLPWWKDAVFYQVYPASFVDSNGDGWGDIPGLVTKLDYLANLGVDCVWLSPVFDSPQADMGYDVSDYQSIYAPYGTVADVDALLAGCHARGMKLILDLVVNHTSVEHSWFKESRSSRASSKRDWYIWRPARYDPITGGRLPPTNWRGYFAGSTWTWDEQTQEYYLHLYAPEQPDLNWDNEDCRMAIYKDTMNFWLDRGVDGFRIDTVNKYSKRDYVDVPVTDPSSYTQPAPDMWCNGPRIHEYIREMAAETLHRYPDAVSVGELSNMTKGPSQVLEYVSASRSELDMVFEFSAIRLGTGDGFGAKYIYTPFPLSRLKRITETWQAFIEGTDGWTTAFVENHDNGRAVSRFGDDRSPQTWRASARCIALWQATLTGTLFLYQGQEIGMTNMPENWSIDEYKDVESQGFYKEAVGSGDVDRIKKTMHGLRILARDHSRLPMRWDGGAPNAGFGQSTDGCKPWMRVVQDAECRGGGAEVSVAAQTGRKESVLEFYRLVLALRKKHRELMVHGSFRLLDPEDEYIFAYVKEASQSVNAKENDRTVKKCVVVLNFSGEAQECVDVAAAMGCGLADVRLLVDTIVGEPEDGRVISIPALGAWEGRVYVNF
ncbi:hypothetical protein MCOR02_011522 [Pyricularia oryzae]|nr:hypothetical protein MCOR01_000255 [Pyricularia oryzae]KAH9428029.1 hypothetical protein MCOR02_011522 [Pyricularia oryzae]KAI6489910.1 hypothetical protein MCOR13_008653 [Pyricularia oryzae]KAI6608628.1 hypothetical protein MCOR04_000091 [Pyricularia oryzae]KAI6643393.1 hypothetical protein MCOR14_002126 [Pyricularia oryzae]